ncbi:MAG: ribosome-associated translation inhibitor RaiA [Burkholderiaceae bacterium]
MTLTPAIRSYVEEKLDRILRHFHQIIEIEVVLGLEDAAVKELRQRAEVTVRVKGDALHAESQADDLYAAIDQVIGKLDKQVLKLKGKVQGHRQESLKRIHDEQI